MLSDSLYEQIIARKFGSREVMIRFLWILLIAAVAVIGGFFLGYVGIFMAIVVAFLVIYLAFPKQKVEYEYDILDYELNFSLIYSKSKQKKKLSIDLRKAEKILPSSSHILQSVNTDKVYDFSSRKKDAQVYAIITENDGEKICIYFEPDEEMRERIRRWVRKYTGDFEI